MFPPKQFQFPTMGCKSDISVHPCASDQIPLQEEEIRIGDQEEEGGENRRINKKSDIPLNNPINLIRFPTCFPHFSDYYIRIYPLPE